jgi:hypothetical protein
MSYNKEKLEPSKELTENVAPMVFNNVRSSPSRLSKESLVWKVGDLKRPVDVTTQAAIFSMSDKITEYVLRLTEEGSEEDLEAKKFMGGYYRGALGIQNCSIHDLVSLILKSIANEVENSAKEN